MFTNRTPDGRNNICGIKVKELRKVIIIIVKMARPLLRRVIFKNYLKENR